LKGSNEGRSLYGNKGTVPMSETSQINPGM